MIPARRTAASALMRKGIGGPGGILPRHPPAARRRAARAGDHQGLEAEHQERPHRLPVPRGRPRVAAGLLDRIAHRAPAIGNPEQLADADDRLLDVRDGGEGKRLDRDAQPGQRLDRAAVFGGRLGEQQVRVDGQDRLGLRIVVPADPSDLLGARVVVEARHADQPVLRAQREDDLRERGRERHHPAHLRRDRGPEVLPRARGEEEGEADDHFAVTQFAAAKVFVPRLDTMACVSSRGRML
jgi:hypothetical protein